MASIAPRSALRAALAVLALVAALWQLGLRIGADERSRPGAPLRALFFGSSTTAGSGSSSPSLRWSATLARRLGWVEVNRGLSGSTLARTGGAIPSGEERWRAALAGEPADAVFVMYGANDVLAGIPLGDAGARGTFRHAAAEVLRGIRETLPRASLVVCAPQPSLATAAARGPYDRALAEAAAETGAIFVPTGEAFPAERLGELSADRLHLNDAGHAAVADFVLARVPARERRGRPRR
ncbi:MAG TPA: SGNH/GDSL hydrolase family protein [Anaeromyxobacteraceae bacterium]|nr:SGNH/GDSL hydrolase family protein [Anaeromyxobacteraceae bacterium]